MICRTVAEVNPQSTSLALRCQSLSDKPIGMLGNLQGGRTYRSENAELWKVARCFAWCTARESGICERLLG